MFSASDAGRKSLALRLTIPDVRSAVYAFLLFCAQMGVFLVGELLLYKNFNPQFVEYLDGPLSAWPMGSQPPFFVAEAAMFLGASILAFTAFRLPWRVAGSMLALEAVSLLFVHVLSMLWGFPCTTLLSFSFTSNFPTCGISTLNISSFAFVLFAVMTWGLWTLLPMGKSGLQNSS